MFDVDQSVENTGDAPVTLAPYGIIDRHGEPDDLIGFYILHEGVVRKATASFRRSTMTTCPTSTSTAAARARRPD